MNCRWILVTLLSVISITTAKASLDTVKIDSLYLLGNNFVVSNPDSANYYASLVYTLCDSKKSNYCSNLSIAIKGKCYTMKQEYDYSNRILLEYLRNKINDPLTKDCNIFNILRYNYRQKLQMDSSEYYLKRYYYCDSTSIQAQFVKIAYGFDKADYQTIVRMTMRIINSSTDSSDINEARSHLAMAYMQQDEYALALESFLEVEQYAKSNGLLRRESITVQNMAVCYRELNNKELQVKCLIRNMELLRKTGFFKEMPRQYLSIAETCLPDLKETKRYYDSAIRYFQHLDNRWEQYIFYSLHLDFYELTNDAYFYPKYTFSIDTVIKMAETDSSLFHLKFAYGLAKQYYHLEKDYEKAFIYSEKKHEVETKVVSKQNFETIESLKTQYETSKKEEQIVLLEQRNELQKQANQRKTLINWLIGGFSIVSLGLLTLLLYRNKKSQNLKLENQKFQSEREITELEQKLLLTQMNPHFIFNSLNSIKDYVLSNDSPKANDYLSELAHLMRLILNSSRKELVTISDELEVLRAYLKLEKLRLDSKFQYDIRLESDLEDEEDDLFIPPMLIQPFIENAIKHGIQNLDNNGHLGINVSKMNTSNSVLVEIVDNGVGRKIARKIRSENNPSHESVAIELTEERIEAFNKKHPGNSINYEIVDLKSSNQKASGTQVLLTFPILTENL